MAILIQVNGNNSGEGFLIAPDGTRTFPVSVGLKTNDGTTVSATLEVVAGAGAAAPAGVVFSATDVTISPVETFIDVHATSASTAPNDTVLQVLVGGVSQASFDLTSIANPEVWFKGRFEARFATDSDFYNEPRGTVGPLGGWTFALEGEPDFVPADSVADSITKPVGRVIRFHNSPVSRQFVPDIGVAVESIRSTLGTFLVGDPIIGQPVDVGPNSYFAENARRNPADPAPAEFSPDGVGGESPIALFEFHIGNEFSGTSTPGTRPTGQGIEGQSPPPTQSFVNFNNDRRTLLQDAFDVLSPAQQAATVGTNLETRIDRLSGSLAWGAQVRYVGRVDSGISFQPSNSSVMSFLAGFTSFNFTARFFEFHADELRGHVEGSVIADVTQHITPLQTGVYEIQSLEASPFNPLTIPEMTTAAIEAILGGAPTEKCVVTVSTDFDRLVVSKATISNSADPPATWIISEIGESLVGEFLPEASVLPKDLVYRILQPGAQGSALGPCEGTPFDPAPQVGFARLFTEGTEDWTLLLHAGTNGAAGVTYKGTWANSIATLADGCVPLDVELLTPTLNFGSVEQGMTMNREIIMLNRSATDVEIGLPVLSSPFTAVSTSPVTIPPGGTGVLLVSFVAGTPGDTPLTSFPLNATPVLTPGLTVSMQGTSVLPTSADVVLVLDRSLSMNEPGVDQPGRFMTKAQLRNEACRVFIQMLRETDRIAIVRFNQDAQIHFAFQEAGPAAGGPGTGRFEAAETLGLPELSPSGNTSIGDGMFEANEMLIAPGSTATKHALVVLTDGKENRDRFIAGVSLGATARAYAIGLGVPQRVDVAKLSAVTGNTGGYLLVTGGPEENEFRLHKYYAQILAGIHGNSVVLDPAGAIDVGQTQKIPFYITEADTNFDVALLTRFRMLAFTLEAPDGTRLDPTNIGSFNGQFVPGRICYYYRMRQPVFPSGSERALGKWHIVIQYPGSPRYSGKKAGKTQIRFDERDKRQFQRLATVKSTVTYQVLVTARSGIQLDAHIEQRGFAPGLDRSIVAFLRASGRPLTDRVNLLAQVTRPDGVVSLVPMAHQGNGRFEAKLDDTKMLGHYNIVVRALGQTPGNFPLQREHTLSGAVLDPAADSLTDGAINQITDLLEAQEGAVKELTQHFTNLLEQLRDNTEDGLRGDTLKRWLWWILIVLILIMLTIFGSLLWR